MASRSFFEEDLSCPVCLDIFRNPVVLSCSHSFCEHCIQRFWRKKSPKICPVCQRVSSHKHPPLNMALRNLCETYQQDRSQKSPSGFCSDHKEKLKLFCLDDQQLVCLVCRDSRKHSNHRFCPVNEVAMDNKEILKASLERLQEELRISVNREQNLCKTAEDIKFQAHLTVTQIKQEFEKLHQFLRSEEAFRITALREEEEQRNQMMEEKMQETTKQISSLTSIIKDIEEQMKAEDVSFLQNVKATLQRAQYSLPDPDPSLNVTITFTDHLTNLKLSVLQKMQDNVGKTSAFRINHSHFLIDEVKYNEDKHVQSAGGNMFGGQQSKKGPLQEVKPMKHRSEFSFKDSQHEEGKEGRTRSKLRKEERTRFKLRKDGTTRSKYSLKHSPPLIRKTSKQNLKIMRSSCQKIKERRT